MLSFSKKEKTLFKKLNTPVKVQDFLNGLRFNFERDDEGRKRETLKSPLYTLRSGRAHCLEGAMLGAYILSLHGFKPYLLHLKTTKDDYSHVVAPFNVGGCWGALSKTNHAVLRYRDPVYRSLRELAMSYFHEYYLNSGEKTLRQYSRLLNLESFEANWMTLDGDLWGIDDALDEIKHYDLLPPKYIKKLRKADDIEIKAGDIVEYKS
jgi:hypothetical protein